MKNKIVVSAPGKLMLFGEHAVVYGRPCIVTAVDQRIQTSVERIADKLLQINAPDVGVVNYEVSISKLGRGDIPKEVKFIEFAVRNFFRKYRFDSGIRVETKSDFSSKFGFGSSSAVTVSVIKALSELFNRKLSKKEIFDLSYQTTLNVQGIGSGFDLAAAIWGRTLYFIAGGKKIDEINIAKNLPLVIGYTGIKADTTTLVKKVANLREEHPTLVDSIFDIIGTIVEESRIALENGNFKLLGELATINYGLLVSLGVSSQELENLIIVAKKKGAYGAKLSGAGGGDCMIAFADYKRRSKIASAIRGVGGTVLTVKTGAEGVRIEK